MVQLPQSASAVFSDRVQSIAASPPVKALRAPISGVGIGGANALSLGSTAAAGGAATIGGTSSTINASTGGGGVSVSGFKRVSSSSRLSQSRLSQRSNSDGYETRAAHLVIITHSLHTVHCLLPVMFVSVYCDRTTSQTLFELQSSEPVEAVSPTGAGPKSSGDEKSGAAAPAPVTVSIPIYSIDAKEAAFVWSQKKFVPKHDPV